MLKYKRVALLDAGALRKLALKDLERSGLTVKDYKKLRLRVMTAKETDEFVGEPRASYKIPYFDLAGNRTAFARVRFIENSKGHVFKAQGSFRYSQPFNSAPHIYYPPYLDWQAIAKDPTYPILITEGEKKAAKACSLGIACIALGGVYGFKSSKRMQDLIPEFDDIQWKDRAIEICYDADVMMKSEVRQALSMIALELSQKYSPASIDFIFLDAETAGPKTGLDDFLMAEGAEKFNALERKPFRSNERIQELNKKVCYVEHYDRFYNIKNKRFFNSLQQVREAFMNEGEEVVDGKRTALIVDLWAKNANRRTVADVLYAPGLAEVTDRNELNTWRPPSIRPRRGSPVLWLEIGRHIFGSYFDWFMQWLAYPVQHIGTKMLQAVFVHGAMQGVGKTFVVDPVMEYVYGPHNFYRLSNDDLQDRFNAYASHTQFVVTNEIYFSDMRDRRMIMSGLKDMVTREKVTVNEKFQPKMVYTDHCNYYLTSNHADALVLDPDDRRFFVIEAPNEKLGNGAYLELNDYLRDKGGGANVLHHLQNVDTSDFNPKGEALFTPAKEVVIGLSKDILTEFIEKLYYNPQELYMVNGHLPDLQLSKSEDIIRLFETSNPHYRFPISTMKVSRIMRELGIPRRKVRLAHDSPQMVLYAIFERDRWHKASNRTWAQHYQENHPRYGMRNKLN